MCRYSFKRHIPSLVHTYTKTHIHILYAHRLKYLKSHSTYWSVYCEAVWKGSRFSLGSAADIDKLTHCKWICNPRVDLNCVYCHGLWACRNSCICFPQSPTCLSIPHFHHMPPIILHTAFILNVMQCSVALLSYLSQYGWGVERVLL